MTPDPSLQGAETFTSLREANLARQSAWANGEAVSMLFRATELGGETGEVLNVCKKIERERAGWRGSRATTQDLADELADVVICADLLALTEGIDLDAAIIRKFNATSEKVGLPHRLAALPEPPSKSAEGVEREPIEIERREIWRKVQLMAGDGLNSTGEGSPAWNALADIHSFAVRQQLGERTEPMNLAAAPKPPEEKPREAPSRLEIAVTAGKALGKLALYFGCWDGAGHYLHDRRGRHIWSDKRPADLPWPDHLMDATLLNNGKHQDRPDGRVWWTCGGKDAFWYAFFWWDRSVDTRGACNSGFYVRGFGWPEAGDAFAYGCAQFPAVVARQKHALILQDRVL